MSLKHPALLKGSGFGSLFKGFPALSLVATLMLVDLEYLLHTALTLAVKSPAVGEIIKGAVIEVDELSVLYQDSLLLSFSSRREQSCQVLALWISHHPHPYTSSPIFTLRP